MNNLSPAADLIADDISMLEMDDLFGDAPGQSPAGNVQGTAGIQLFRDVPLTVTLEVASTEVTLGELSSAKAGDVLPLDKAVGEPLDVKVNGVLFAKAEVVMVNGRYGLKFVARPAAGSAGTDAGSAAQAAG